MKKIFLAALAIAAAACSNQQTFTINGTTADEALNGTTVYLVNGADGNKIDSTTIVDGKFAFGTIGTENVVSMRVMAGRSGAVIIPQAGVINVELGRPSVVGGTSLNDTYAAYQKESSELSEAFMEKYKALEAAAAPEAEVDAAYDNYQADAVKIAKKYLESNKENALGVLMLVNVLGEEMSSGDADALIATVPMAALYAPVAKLRAQKVAVETTAVGKMFADFTGKKLDGTEAKLSDFVGKGDYILVDFWASWCGPCKMEMPYIKDVYEKFNGKGFTVVGANVWERGATDHLKTIEEDKLPWSQIICFGDNTPTDTYGVRGIPTLVLFAPDGTIVDRTLRGEKMVEIVTELMSKK